MEHSLPLSLRCDGRPVLVVGAGAVAARKAQTLEGLEIHARIVGPGATAIPSAPGRSRHDRPFDELDLDGCALAVAAADDETVNDRVAEAAARAGLVCVRADRPDGAWAFCASSAVGEGVVLAIAARHHSGPRPGLAGALLRRLAPVARGLLQRAGVVGHTGRETVEGWLERLGRA